MFPVRVSNNFGMLTTYLSPTISGRFYLIGSPISSDNLVVWWCWWLVMKLRQIVVHLKIPDWIGIKHDI